MWGCSILAHGHFHTLVGTNISLLESYNYAINFGSEMKPPLWVTMNPLFLTSPLPYCHHWFLSGFIFPLFSFGDLWILLWKQCSFSLALSAIYAHIILIALQAAHGGWGIKLFSWQAIWTSMGPLTNSCLESYVILETLIATICAIVFIAVQHAKNTSQKTICNFQEQELHLS
jgi:hypothetical protein